MANPKQEPVPAELCLSPEVWEQIFQRLGVRELQCVRLTCRSWRDIVSGSPRLMGKLPLKVSSEDVHGSDFFQKATQIELWPSGPNNWPPLGERLTHLELIGCGYVLLRLVAMLRQTPNLKTLKLAAVEFPTIEGVVVDFRLNKLETLEIQTGVECLGVFGQMCTRLKTFELTCVTPNSELDELIIVNFIRAVQDTVEDINLMITTYMSLEISQLERLNLKNVFYRWHRKDEDNDDSNIVAFCRKQRNIQQLRVAFSTINTNQDLCDIGRSLPRLKDLLCKMDTSRTLSFTTCMPLLEQLEIYGDNGNAQFVKFNNANLTKLCLHRMIFPPGSLQSLLEGSPNLQSLTLQDSICETLDELFAMLGQLKSLHHLKLRCLDVQNFAADCPPLEPLRKLTKLSVDQCMIPRDQIAALLRQCGQLQDVLLRGVVINDDLILTVCLSSPQLNKLAVMSCPITDESAEAIVDHCHALRELHLERCASLSDEALERLKSVEGLETSCRNVR